MSVAVIMLCRVEPTSLPVPSGRGIALEFKASKGFEDIQKLKC